MSDAIPDGITKKHVEAAIRDLRDGRKHLFADSTKYDLLDNGGRRYPPKAVLGLAANPATGGEPLGPYDFKGGLGSKCFRILVSLGYRQH